MVCLDNECNESINDGGYMAMSFKSSSPKKSSSSSSSKLSTKKSDNDPTKDEFSRQIKLALDRIFENKPPEFLIINKDLHGKLIGKIIVDDKEYIVTFNTTESPIKRSTLSNRFNWKIEEYVQNGASIGLLKDITIDIVALDAKESEKKAHFAGLLPRVIDDIFNKIGTTSVLKKNTDFQRLDSLFNRVSGIVKMNDNDYYEVTFRSSLDKVGINDLKNINNWYIKYDVYEYNRQSTRLFENIRNQDFSVYKTILSNVGLTKLFR